MNNKQQLTKVSVLIDKLNYLNDNLEFNTLKVTDLDFQLLKNYSAELWQILQKVAGNDDLSAENQELKEQLFEQLPNTSDEIPKVSETSLAPEKSDIAAFRQADSDTSVEHTAELLMHNNDQVVAKTSSAGFFIPDSAPSAEEIKTGKETRENIFDTVKKIKKQHYIEEEKPSAKPAAFEAETERQEQVRVEDLSPPKSDAIPLSIKKEEKEVESDAVEQVVDETHVPIKSFDFMPSKVKEANVSVQLGNVKEATPPMQFEPSIIETADLENEEAENDSPSLNDRFKKQEGSLGATIKKSSSSRNFKELIDINDRFLFIQSLFGGSYLAFEDAIKQINKIERYSEALDYVDYKLKDTYDWSTESTEVTKFLNILERSYQ